MKNQNNEFQLKAHKFLKPDEIKQEIKDTAKIYLKDKWETISQSAKLEFCMIMQLYDLNPLKREIYFIQNKNGTHQIITSYEIYKDRATRHPDFAGFKIEKTFKENGQPDIYKFIGARKSWKLDYETTMKFDEYKQSFGLWLNKPDFMLEKCLLAKAFRAMFAADELNLNLYVAEEMWEENNEVNAIVESEIKENE